MDSKFGFGAWLVAALLIAASISAYSQQQSAGQDDGAPMSRQQATELLLQLKSLRQLLASQVPAQPVETKVRDAGYSLGDRDAPVTVVEFSDYQCPFCAQFQNDNFVKLRHDFVQTGKVRFVIRDWPLARHSDALKAAEAARCGGDQGKFWEVRDALVAHSRDLKEASLLADAQHLGLDTARFQQCLESDKFLPEIRQDEADAKAAGINATPSFVVGKAENGQVDGVLLVGALPYSRFSEQISKGLTGASKKTTLTTTVTGESR
jgi:protein-disulfide isomerase